MLLWSAFRIALLALASLGYLANGAQAHLHVSGGETLEVMLCGSGNSRALRIEVPSEPIEETEDTCCGDCVPAVAIFPPESITVSTVTNFSQLIPARMPLLVSPRSPLWPGAPPHGPPNFLEA